MRQTSVVAARGIERELKSAGLQVIVQSTGDFTEIKAYRSARNMMEKAVRRFIDLPDLVYAFTKKGIRGPNPSMFNDGKTRMHAAVQNITDDLFVDDLIYNPTSGIYQKISLG